MTCIEKKNTHTHTHTHTQANEACSCLIISQVRNYTLVSDDGVIRPEIFYKALTLWVDRDVLGYAFSQVC